MGPDPYDQADGFHGDGPNDWAAREAQGAYDDAWDFIFSLERLSKLKEWDEMRKDLANFKGDIPYHDFSEKAFHHAAQAGQADILEKMYAKKFRLSPDDAETLIENLASFHLPQAEPAIGFLLENGCKGDRAVHGIAGTGTPAMMAILKEKGCDIQMGGDAFPLTLATGNTGMMKYLYEQGADIYTPSVVCGLYGGIEAFQSRNRDHVVSAAPDARKFHESLCDLDARRWAAFYATAAGNAPSLDDFRGLSDGAADRSMTLLQLAARAGCIESVVEVAARATANPLTAEDVLCKSDSGASVLSILAARGEAHKIFDARLWWRNPEEAKKLHDGLKALGADAAIDPSAFAADLQQCRLKELAKTTRVSLKPRPPRP
ncbi:MAG: hypothetical protein ACAH83_18280 [Alphaproteobacteria bacterium]